MFPIFAISGRFLQLRLKYLSKQISFYQQISNTNCFYLVIMTVYYLIKTYFGSGFLLFLLLWFLVFENAYYFPYLIICIVIKSGFASFSSSSRAFRIRNKFVDVVLVLLFIFLKYCFQMFLDYLFFRPFIQYKYYSSSFLFAKATKHSLAFCC